MKRFPYQIVLAIVLSLFTAASASAQVSLTKTPPTCDIKVIDPHNPPPEKSLAAPNHPAFTWCNYSATWHFRYETEKQSDGGRSAAYITLQAINLKLILNSTIWLPANAPDYLLEHERGHQKIGESAYSGADRIAHRIAEKMIGATFRGEGPTEAAAEKAASDHAGDAFLLAYLAAVRDPGQRVHDLYDEITNHGLNRSIPVDDAVRQAIARWRAERKERTASIAEH